MGKRTRKDNRGRYGRNKKNRGEDGGEWPQKKEENFGEWVYTNEDFIKYYKAQGIVDDADWDVFMKHLATPLPTTFRINNSCPFAERIRERIAMDFKFDGLVVDDEEVAPISVMPWYPDQKGFQWSVERRRVRKLPILAEFQKWLVELSNSGSITRQEAVSMIPPLVLGVEPHHKVLDMCAAPGSKTSQLLESLHADERITGKTPTGMVVANDVDLKRAYMLVHQSKRIGSPALVVTCHEAQHIPYLGDATTQTQGFFDRILCDAPCSGDGTLRKNPIIWKQFSPKNGIALHPLQLEIAKRGASLLKVGGFMCYSTCTFNPLENEAIVAELLRWSNGALELVDVTQTLPMLKRRSGKSTWKVLDSTLTEYESIDHFKIENDKERKKDKITQTMFPPTKEEATRFQLERCMRCVPQDENTGGFFICLLKKLAPTPKHEDAPPSKRKDWKPKATNGEVASTEAATTEAATTVPADEEVTAKDTGIDNNDDEAAPVDTIDATNENGDVADAKPQKNYRRDRRNRNKGEEYVAFDHNEWLQVQDYYAIEPTFRGEQLLTRSEESKSVTFVTESITMGLLEEMKTKKLKVVYTGLKMFERNETGGDNGKVYRLCQAGLHHVLPYMHRRKAAVSPKEFQMMMERLGDLLDFDEFEPDTRKLLEEAPVGSIVCSLTRPSQSLVEKMVMNVVVWRGRNSVNVMAAKADAVVILAAMKEMKLYDSAVRDEVLKIKQQKDTARADRQQVQPTETEANASTETTKPEPTA